MTEYLVEVTQGREEVYPTILALRAALRSGEITAESRVYHRAAARWISITEHPEYRKYLAERRPADWLKPIPFDTAEQLEPRWAPHGLRSLVTKLEQAGATVRGWFARRGPARGAPRSLPTPDEESGHTPPPNKSWTFLP
jgi:hypothetical protein